MALIDTALSAHVTTLNTAAGQTITYKRGTATVSLTAVVGQSQFEDVTSTGEIRQLSKTVDWIVAPSALVLDGSVTVPQRGDQISKADGSTYDVLPGTEGTAWQYSDGRQALLRIHTVKRVAS